MYFANECLFIFLSEQIKDDSPVVLNNLDAKCNLSRKIEPLCVQSFSLYSFSKFVNKKNIRNWPISNSQMHRDLTDLIR